MEDAEFRGFLGWRAAVLKAYYGHNKGLIRAEARELRLLDRGTYLWVVGNAGMGYNYNYHY